MTDTCNTTLLSCPFCGTAPVIMEYNFVPHAFCQPCGCTLEADKWNTRATRPTRDAAEGATPIGEDTPYWRTLRAALVLPVEEQYAIAKDLAANCGYELTGDAYATPQPAPDAIREYVTRLKEIGDWLAAKGNVHDASALYSIARALIAPVPSPDGAVFQCPECECDIAFEPHGPDCSKRLDAPLATGAAEPVAWQKRPTFGDVRIWTLVEHSPHTHDFWREQEYELRPLYATPPVRGDREEIADDIRSREPTPAMRIIGGVAWINAMKSAETYVDCADACWKAMWDKASI